MQCPAIETSRFTMRGFSADDLDRLADILGKPAVTRYLPGSTPYSRDRAEAALRNILKHWEENGYGWWAIDHNAEARLIGWCGLGIVEELAETEVAYLFDQPYWGQGIATEAAHASLRYGFEELELEQVIALAHTENIASQRVMEKNGMVCEQELHLWGLDLAKYSIKCSDFQPTKAAYILR